MLAIPVLLRTVEKRQHLEFSSKALRRKFLSTVTFFIERERVRIGLELLA